MKESELMKDFIYLDTSLVNSYLAQLDSGLLTKVITGSSSSNSNQEDGGSETTATAEGEVSAVFVKGKGTHSNKEIDKFSTVYSKTNNELIETAMHDFSLDVLISKLNENDLLNSTDGIYSDGDFISITDTPHIYNFKQLHNSAKRENIDLVLNKLTLIKQETEKLKNLRNQPGNKSTEKQKKMRETEENIELLESSFTNWDHSSRMGEFCDILFPDSCLIKINNTISICPNKNLRMNSAVLGLLSSSKRKPKLLGTIIFKKEKDHAPEDNELLETDVIIDTMQMMQSDIMLSSFKLISIGDYYIRPIAIYYEYE